MCQRQKQPEPGEDAANEKVQFGGEPARFSAASSAKAIFAFCVPEEAPQDGRVRSFGMRKGADHGGMSK